MSKINRHPVRRTAAGVLAGALALSGAVAAGTPAFAATGFALERLQGDDRYETSAAIATQFGAATSVILASGEQGRTPDALAANFLAGVRNAPVLLTRRDTTPLPILAAIRASGATRITVVGGPVAISDLQIQTLRDAGFTVDRVAGDDRFETAAEIAEAGEGATASNVGLVASGFSTIDALAGGPLAFAGKHPLFLVTRNGIPAATLAAMRSTGITSVYILGGEAVVGAEVATQLQAAGITIVDRLAGDDRSETSVEIANELIAEHGFSANTFNLASGLNEGIDALGGAALSGKERRVLLITNTATSAGPVTQFAEDNAARLNTVGRIFGGTTMVAPALEQAIEQAAVGTNAGVTARPELVSAAIVATTTADQVSPDNPAGTTVRYTFDEAVLGASSPPVAANFKVYDAAGAMLTGNTVVSNEAGSVVVRFTGITTTAQAATLTLATVVPGAVRDADGNQNPEGDAAIGTTTPGGGATTLAAGITDGPDLVSVGGFRQAATAGSTAVDFVFDEAAFVNANNRFVLLTLANANGVANDNQINATSVPAAGSDPVSAGGEASGGTIAGGNGTTTLTVIFDRTITAAEVARATILDNSVSDVQQDADTATAVTGNANPRQAVDVSNGGNTAEPDLVSAELRPSTTGTNAVLFTFDQPVSTAVAGNFNVYTDEGVVRPGTGTAQINTADARQVLVNVADLSRVVGATVGDGAVTVAASETNATADANEQDEVGIAGTTIGGTEGQTAGQTAGPDLTSVTIARGAATTDPSGNVTQGTFAATYTFDEDVDAVTTPATGFKLYLADGTALTGGACAVGTGTAATTDDDDFDNTVVCTTFTGGVGGDAGTGGTAEQRNAELGSAVLGTVVMGAVNEQDAGTVVNAGVNPEGAAATTGGTGTPRA